MNAKAITMTVYLLVDEKENAHKWDVAEWLSWQSSLPLQLGTPDVVGWDITDGHPEGCPGCEASSHD